MQSSSHQRSLILQTVQKFTRKRSDKFIRSKSPPTQPYIRFGGGFLVRVCLFELCAESAPNTLERIYVSDEIRDVLVGQK